MNYRLSREEIKALLLEMYHLGASSPFDLAESIVESAIEDQLASKVDKQISYVTTTSDCVISSNFNDNVAYNDSSYDINPFGVY